MTRAPAPTRWAASAATPGRRAPSTADQRPLGTISTSSAAFSPSVTMCSKCERAVTSWFAMASGGGRAVCLPSGPYDLSKREDRSGRVSQSERAGGTRARARALGVLDGVVDDDDVDRDARVVQEPLACRLGAEEELRQVGPHPAALGGAVADHEDPVLLPVEPRRPERRREDDDAGLVLGLVELERRLARIRVGKVDGHLAVAEEARVRQRREHFFARSESSHHKKASTEVLVQIASSLQGSGLQHN